MIGSLRATTSAPTSDLTGTLFKPAGPFYYLNRGNQVSPSIALRNSPLTLRIAPLSPPPKGKSSALDSPRGNRGFPLWRKIFSAKCYENFTVFFLKELCYP